MYGSCWVPVCRRTGSACAASHTYGPGSSDSDSGPQVRLQLWFGRRPVGLARGQGQGRSRAGDRACRGLPARLSPRPAPVPPPFPLLPPDSPGDRAMPPSRWPGLLTRADPQLAAHPLKALLASGRPPSHFSPSALSSPSLRPARPPLQDKPPYPLARLLAPTCPPRRPPARCRPRPSSRPRPPSSPPGRPSS